MKFLGCVDCKITCMAKASESAAGWSLQIKQENIYRCGSIDIRE